MSEFQWGDPHPLAIDRRNRKHELDMRVARKFLGILSNVAALYLQGRDGISSGRTLYQREAANIRHWQIWADRRKTAEPSAAALCRDYPLIAAEITNLWLPVDVRIQWLKSALAACRYLRDREGMSRVLGNLGFACADRYDNRQAVHYYKKQLAIARQLRDRRGERNALANIGIAFTALDKARQGITYLRRSAAISKEIQDHRGEVLDLGSLGNAYLKLGQARKAIKVLKHGLELAQRLDFQWSESNKLTNLGTAYFSLGRYRSAISHFQRGLAIARVIYDRRGEALDLENLGHAYMALGEATTGIDFFEQAILVFSEINDQRGTSDCLGALGEAYSSVNDDAQALKCYLRRLEFCREFNDREDEAVTSMNVAILLAELTRFEEAIAYAKLACSLFEDLNSEFQRDAMDLLDELLVAYRIEMAGTATTMMNGAEHEGPTQNNFAN